MAEVGYLVRIHDTGQLYDTYVSFFDACSLGHLKSHFVRGRRPQSLDIMYRVVDIHSHPHGGNDTLYVLESIGTQDIYLCSILGLTTARMLPEELYQGIISEGERSEPECQDSCRE